MEDLRKRVVDGLKRYRDAGWTGLNEVYLPIVRDALTLLDMPVKTEKKRFVICGEDEYGVTDFTMFCGACGTWLQRVYPRPKYCPQCGRKVEWDD